uniref:Uncharacterized protein n=1 Tax=Arundo donax TaxID=35708 RepID=A0A0A8YJ39_ARUDO
MLMIRSNLVADYSMYMSGSKIYKQIKFSPFQIWNKLRYWNINAN